MSEILILESAPRKGKSEIQIRGQNRILRYFSMTSCISMDPIISTPPSPRTLRLFQRSANMTNKEYHPVFSMLFLLYPILVICFVHYSCLLVLFLFLPCRTLSLDCLEYGVMVFLLFLFFSVNPYSYVSQGAFFIFCF